MQRNTDTYLSFIGMEIHFKVVINPLVILYGLCMSIAAQPILQAAGPTMITAVNDSTVVMSVQVVYQGDPDAGSVTWARVRHCIAAFL